MFCPLSHASKDVPSLLCFPVFTSSFFSLFSSPFFFLLPSPPLPTHHLLSTGIAVDKNGLIYFVDGTTIRKVDQNGIISTFLGSNDLTSARPLTCDNSMDINQVTYTETRREAVNSASELFAECVTVPPCAPHPPAPSPLTRFQNGPLQR